MQEAEPRIRCPRCRAFVPLAALSPGSEAESTILTCPECLHREEWVLPALHRAWDRISLEIAERRH